MSIYRNIVAVMAAIVVASPLCCCSLSAFAQEKGPEMTCCSHENATGHGCPVGQSCPECHSNDPLLSDVGKTTTFKGVLPEVAPIPHFAAIPELTGGVFAPSQSLDLPDPGPPGWRLVFHQIFLL